MNGFDPKALMARARNLFSGFTTGQKAMTAIAVVAAVVGGTFFVSWVSQPTYAPLFTSLSSTDAAAITAKLTEAKEPYQLADGGTTVLVPQADVYQQRINLSGQGLPAGGGNGDGYSLLDKQSLTTSDFQQKVTYQRALEGELRKTIESIDGVQAAVVHLALPEQDVFTSDAAKPTASVLVKTAPGTSLTSSQVEAVVHLVSSAVPKLDASAVTVADASGQVLSAAGQDGASSALNDARAQQSRTASDATAAAVQSMLDKVVGPGHAVVRVDTSLNYDQQTVDREEYLVDKKQVPLTVSTSKETFKGNGSAVGGVLGPDNISVPSGTGGSASTYTKESGDQTNAVGTQKTHTTAAPGQVKRMTVAVVLDAATTGSADPKQISALVASAAGLDTARGDVVTVDKLPFDTKAAAAAAKELAQAESDKRTSDLINLAKTVGLVLLLALALFVFARRSRKVERTPVDLGELEAYREERAQLARPQTLAIDSGLGSQAVLEAPKPISPEAEMRAAMHDEISQFIDDQPDEVARLVRGWLVERRP
ncbi:MAG: flagellar basal-body MS-ring/collar protein FliF [Oryzihumus sp.]